VLVARFVGALGERQSVRVDPGEESWKWWRASLRIISATVSAAEITARLGLERHRHARRVSASSMILGRW